MRKKVCDFFGKEDLGPYSPSSGFQGIINRVQRMWRQKFRSPTCVASQRKLLLTQTELSLVGKSALALPCLYSVSAKSAFIVGEVLEVQSPPEIPCPPMNTANNPRSTVTTMKGPMCILV